jgi:serine protease Do
MQANGIRRWRSGRPWGARLVMLALLLGSSPVLAGADTFWQEGGSAAKPVLPKGYDPMPSLAGLVKQLDPAVVNIYTTQVIKPGGRSMGRMNPYWEFFGRNPDPYEYFFGGPRREFKTRSLGSGFIISPDGYLVTNAHVVDNATVIRVKLADERTFDARVVGVDSKTDVALLKVDAKGKLPTVSLGDSDALEVGDWVIAIGNPFGLSHTVTVGIISARSRQIGQGPYDDFLQTDASINPGNSGGPLFDARGQVVGINTAIVAHASGIGFAVPINLAKTLLPQLRVAGRVRRGWLGLGIQDLTEELAENFGVKSGQGVLVSQVFIDSPAARAGLRAGDVVLSVDGVKVTDGRGLTRAVGALAPQVRIRIEVLRDGKRKTFRVKLAEREAGEAAAVQRPFDKAAEGGRALGLTLTPLTAQRARRLGLGAGQRGLVVTGVDPDGPASGEVVKGDLILEVNRRPVASLAEVNKVLGKKGTKPRILLRIQRGDSQVYVVIRP